MMRVLLEHGAALEVHMLDGDTPLHQAAWQGHADGVQLLLRSKADARATKVRGWGACVRVWCGVCVCPWVVCGRSALGPRMRDCIIIIAVATIINRTTR